MIGIVGVYAAGAVLASWGFGGSVEGDGKKTTEVRPLPAAVRKVSTSVSLDVEIKEGDATGIRITIDENLQPLVRTRVSGDELEIDSEHGLQYHGDGRIEITVARLESARTAGSGDLRVVTAPIPRDLELASDGSGDVSLQGRARNLRLTTGGSGTIEATCDAEEVHLETSGSGGVTYAGKSKALHATTSGSGGLRLKGATDSLDAVSSGSGGIEARDLAAKTAHVKTAGSGDLTLTLTGGELSIVASGSGDVDWWGQASSVSTVAATSGDVRHH